MQYNIDKLLVFIVFVFSFVISRNPALSDQHDLNDDSKNIIRVLSEQYLANRNSFPIFVCHYTVSTVKIHSIEDVIQGQYEKKTKNWDGTFIVDTDALKLELICSQTLQESTKKIIEQNIQERKKTQDENHPPLAVPCLNRQIIQNRLNHFELNKSETLKNATLQPGNVGLNSNLRETPWDMGIMGGNEVASPSKCISDAVKGLFSYHYEGLQSYYNMNLETVTLFPKGFEYKYGFDPKTGYLPRYIFMSDNSGQITTESFITQIKEFPGGRWFPMQSIVIVKRENKILLARIYEVNNISVDQKPEKRLLEMELPKDYQISVAGFEDQWLRVKDEKLSISPDALEDIQKACIENAKEYAKITTPPEQLIVQYRHTVVRTILIVSGIVLIILGLILKIRKQR